MATDTWQQSLETSTVSGTRASERPPIERLPALTIVAHPDLRRIGARVVLPALVSGRGVELSRTTPLFSQPGSTDLPRPLTDPRLSRTPILLEPANGGVRIVRGEHTGEIEVDGQPLGDALTLPRERLERGAVLLLARRAALLVHTALPVVELAPHRFELVGASDDLEQLRHEIARAAALDVPVLLRGETGTGKELVARALHAASERGERPWVALNMAAVPASLAAAELFGAERGAFTGADQRRTGYFRRAEGGTLFLDEIGATPPEIQDLLLRALETREIQPVGASATHRVDVRILAATDADLETAVEKGSFRAPLFHRLSGWEIRVPPLREHRDDVARLLVHFLTEELAALSALDRLADPGPHAKPWLSAPLLARLVAHHWPGNVRQLRAAARQLAIAGALQPEAVLGAQLERELGSQPPSAAEPPAEHSLPAAPTPARSRASYRQPSEVGDEELLAALRKNRWRLQPTAATLGVSRTSLYALIDRCPQIRKAADLDHATLEQALEAHGGDLDALAEALEVSRHGLLLRLRELGLREGGPASPPLRLRE